MAQKGNITVLLYAHNDERHIERAINSAKLVTKNVKIIDISSTDRTPEIARELGIDVIKVKNSAYVELVRMIGIGHVETDWVFILDSDEVITPELADEARSVLSSGATHFKISRKNIFGPQKWLKHGGWWPDYQTRLIKCSAIVSWPTKIHSTPQIEGEMGLLKSPLLHYSHGNFSDMVKKTIKFEGVESELLYKAHKKVAVFTFFRKFLGELYRRLIKNKGFLDGREGFAESIYQAYSKTVTYLMLYEKGRPIRSVS